jgi:hypothetical protein
MAKRKMTKAEWAAFREQALANAAYLRQLAEKTRAELESRPAASSSD